MEEKRTLEIIAKDGKGNEQRLWMDLSEYELNKDWLDYREWLLFRFPPAMLWSNPTMRIPDREGEVDSFENWKLNGKPKSSLFNYGTLVKNEYEGIKKLLGMI